jgi:EpsD family peptidyl-prolyl cis-trans isomerase
MQNKTINQRLLNVAVVLACGITLAACGGSKDKKPGQSLASVNGEDITVLQLNEEMQRAGVQAAQQEAASKRLLESLIDRQLLQGAAVQEKLDRDPKVVQAIERAKSLILAQAYLQKRVGEPTRPTPAAVEEYFNKHPELFVQRKQLDMRQLVLATKDLDDALKAQIDSAKSLEEVAAWMDAHKLRYARNQIARSSADLPPELSSKLLAMQRGQLFIVKEGERSILSSIVDIKETPVTLAAATPQIEQFLLTQKNKQAAEAEVARLRATAKIEYLNQQAAPAAPAASSPAPGAPAPAPAAAAPAASANESTERGVAGLK